MPDARLIERWLPIAAIGEESIRERRSMTALPPIYYLHVWWARRPLAGAATPARPPITITCKPGDSLDHVADGSIDLVVMDPPYYDNVMYAELSDFFYVWLKRTAGHVFPEEGWWVEDQRITP